MVSVSTPPTAPTGIDGTTTICLGNFTTLTATGGSIGDGCTYEWGAGNCGSNIISGQTGISIDVNPTSNTTYWVHRVGASLCNETTTDCATVMVMVNSVPEQPGTIFGPTSVTAGSGAQTYNISAVSGAISYTWTLPTGWTGNSTITSISATPSSNAQSGNISVTANNDCGSSTERTLEVMVTVGIDDVLSNQLQIFPNPTNDEIYIKTDLQIEKVEIYSLLGSLLISENSFKGKISVSALPTGTYLLKVYTDKGMIVSKVVKE